MAQTHRQAHVDGAIREGAQRRAADEKWKKRKSFLMKCGLCCMVPLLIVCVVRKAYFATKRANECPAECRDASKCFVAYCDACSDSPCGVETYCQVVERPDECELNADLKITYDVYSETDEGSFAAGFESDVGVDWLEDGEGMCSAPDAQNGRGHSRTLRKKAKVDYNEVRVIAPPPPSSTSLAFSGRRPICGKCGEEIKGSQYNPARKATCSECGDVFHKSCVGGHADAQRWKCEKCEDRNWLTDAKICTSGGNFVWGSQQAKGDQIVSA